MNLQEIEHDVAGLDVTQGFDLIYDLLRAYGLPKASITRLQTGTYNRAKSDDERLWKDKLYYRYIETGGDDLHAAIDAARNDERIMKERPRFLIVRDPRHLLAVDTKTNTTLDVPLADLPSNYTFFLPWAGAEKTQLENLNIADRKAAEKMARLYDEIVKHNSILDEDSVRHLNIFFSRLLFCFFAEDTKVFDKGNFTNAIGSYTRTDGTDTGRFLDELFVVLNTSVADREGVPTHLQSFGYVNGSLFDSEAPSPAFSTTARRIILECGTLDWAQINPDIFGSMIQAVVQPGQRESLGMHYTSVDNIMKVIRPLFLDELEEALAAADTVGKLEKLLARICDIKVFDPACGSGNFLVIAYKELRRLEHIILQRIGELAPHGVGLFKLSGIKLDHFYGIEIDDFAHEIAILSLWLAKHQMNVEFEELFGVEQSLIPLRDTGNVMSGNAARVDWRLHCPPGEDEEIYLLGNPPYRGAKLQSAENKGDFEFLFGTSKYARNLDYISIWMLKGAEYLRGTSAELAFVTTNSICQGNHVGLLWPLVFEMGASISFAHQSFLWSNQAKGNAGVSCIVVGLSTNNRRERVLYSDGARRTVGNINAYLRPSSRATIVHGRSTPLSEHLPNIREGSRPNDGGQLTLTPGERDQLLAEEPDAGTYLRRYMGSREFLNGIERYCLWISDGDADRASQISAIKNRLDAVRTSRLRSGMSAQSVAERPHRFDHRVHQDAPAIIIPSVSSERRPYIPMGFLDGGTVVSNLAYAIYGAEAWLFGLLQSRLHMLWVDAVAGRMKTDYRYSGSLCYNTFPLPGLNDSGRTLLAELAMGVLAARESHSGLTTAQLYHPEKMPTNLRTAHRDLDEGVEILYRKRPFDSDDERLELLFNLYEEELVEAEGGLVHA